MGGPGGDEIVVSGQPTQFWWGSWFSIHPFGPDDILSWKRVQYTGRIVEIHPSPNDVLHFVAGHKV